MSCLIAKPNTNVPNCHEKSHCDCYWEAQLAEKDSELKSQCMNNYSLSVENDNLRKEVKKTTEFISKMEEENRKLKEKVRLNDEFLQQVNTDRF